MWRQVFNLPDSDKLKTCPHNLATSPHLAKKSRGKSLTRPSRNAGNVAASFQLAGLGQVENLSPQPGNFSASCEEVQRKDSNAAKPQRRECGGKFSTCRTRT